MLRQFGCGITRKVKLIFGKRTIVSAKLFGLAPLGGLDRVGSALKTVEGLAAPYLCLSAAGSGAARQKRTASLAAETKVLPSGVNATVPTIPLAWPLKVTRCSW